MGSVGLVSTEIADNGIVKSAAGAAAADVMETEQPPMQQLVDKSEKLSIAESAPPGTVIWQADGKGKRNEQQHTAHERATTHEIRPAPPHVLRHLTLQ